MGEIRITFREFRNRELPTICIDCGRRARYFVERRYTVENYRRTFGAQTTNTPHVAVDIPVCRKHSEVIDRTEAQAIGDKSIILRDALWDIRDGVVQLVPEPGGEREDDEPPPLPRSRRRRRHDEDYENMVHAGRSHSA